MKLYFLFNGKRYYSFRKWCLEYGVNYSCARYCLKDFYNNKYELNAYLLGNPDTLDILIDRYPKHV